MSQQRPCAKAPSPRCTALSRTLWWRCSMRTGLRCWMRAGGAVGSGGGFARAGRYPALPLWAECAGARSLSWHHTDLGYDGDWGPGANG